MRRGTFFMFYNKDHDKGGTSDFGECLGQWKITDDAGTI